MLRKQLGIVLVVSINLLSGNIGAAAEVSKESLPPWANKILLKVSATYKPVHWLDPFQTRGDFNGDGKPDVAVLVKNKINNKTGIAILIQGSEQPNILGAGTEFADLGDDFHWLTGWNQAGPDPMLENKLDRISLDGPIGGFIYWQGSAFGFARPQYDSEEEGG